MLSYYGSTLIHFDSYHLSPLDYNKFFMKAKSFETLKILLLSHKIWLKIASDLVSGCINFFSPFKPYVLSCFNSHVYYFHLNIYSKVPNWRRY